MNIGGAVGLVMNSAWNGAIPSAVVNLICDWYRNVRIAGEARSALALSEQQVPDHDESANHEVDVLVRKLEDGDQALADAKPEAFERCFLTECLMSRHERLQ